MSFSNAGTIRKPEIIASCVSFVFFLLVIAGLSFYGTSSRIYLEYPFVVEVSKSHNALAVWNQKKIKGRILILFDRKPGIAPIGVPASEDNYVYLAIKESIIRKVIHVIPDAKWDAVENALSENPSFRVSGGVYQSRVDGVKLQVMRKRSMPEIDEKTLLHINGDFWDILELAELLREKGASSDIVTLTGEISDKDIRSIQGLL